MDSNCALDISIQPRNILSGKAGHSNKLSQMEPQNPATLYDNAAMPP